MRHLRSVTDLEWEGYLGKTDTLVSMSLLGRYPVKVQDFWTPAVDAMHEALIFSGYEYPCDYIGSYLKRPIAGTDVWSWHSYGGAIDLDYGGDNPDSPDHPGIDKNPHIHEPIQRGFVQDGRFQITEAQVEAVERIRTVNGKQVWRWLGWAIGDTMHFEPACKPSDIKLGLEAPVVVTTIRLDVHDPRVEPILWDLFYIRGGIRDHAKNASQNLQSVGLGDDPRMLQEADSIAIGEALGIDPPATIWPYGWEQADLHKLAMEERLR